MAERLIINCNCGQRFSMEYPQSDVVNKPGYSTIISIHEKSATCVHCGQEWSPLIAGVNINWGVGPVERRNGSGSGIVLAKKLPS